MIFLWLILVSLFYALVVDGHVHAHSLRNMGPFSRNSRTKMFPLGRSGMRGGRSDGATPLTYYEYLCSQYDSVNENLQSIRSYLKQRGIFVTSSDDSSPTTLNAAILTSPRRKIKIAT